MRDQELALVPAQTRYDLEQFIRLPWRVYAGNPCWVPPLLMERRRFFCPARNPFYRHADVQLLLACRGRRAVGRIAVFVNHTHNCVHQERAAGFGFFEVLPDPAAAALLLETAAMWARSRGMAVLRGPLNFAADNECGLLLDAYDRPPVLMTAYNPPSYRAYIEGAGFAKGVDWYAYTIDRETLGGGDPARLPPRLRRRLELARCRSGVTVRGVRMAEFERELGHLQRIYNRAWERNWGHVPLSDAEIAYLAAGLRPFVDPDLALFAEADGEPVGVSITLPDLNQLLRLMHGRLLPLGWRHLLSGRRRIDTVRVFAMGVLPEYRRRGVEALFYAETLRAAVRKGYRRAELSLIVETNTAMRRSVEALGARIDKTYRVYEKKL